MKILIIPMRYFPGYCNQQLHKLLLIFSIFALVSCKKDVSRPVYPAGSNEDINTWILDSLKRYYYWAEQLPDHADISKAPQLFLNSVKNTADPFSYVILPNDPSTAPVNNKSKYGFDYSTVIEKGSGLVFGVVKLVLNDSPASRNGLLRGNYISRINGKPLTADNAKNLQDELLLGNNVKLTLARIDGKQITTDREVELISGPTFEQQPISKIWDDGSKKIGYLYVNDFNTGLAASLYPVFAAFKSAGVTDLILDLRYNSGGQVAEAAGLAAMIANGINYATPFIIYQGNKNGGRRTESIGSAATFDGTVDFNIATQYNLGLKQVYILGTGATASASEVMINNLKPYIRVILVGDITRGKDAASFRIYDMRTPKRVEWEMHPIVYKLFNAAGDGNYSKGITPDIPINEMETLPLLPFGSSDDPLVSKSIAMITGRKAATASSAHSNKIALQAGVILTDSRLASSSLSMVITHR